MSSSLLLSRRGFLRSTSLAFLATGAAPLRAEEAQETIDGHVHVWSSDLRRYPLSHGFSRKKDMVPPSFTPEQLFAHSRPQGVNRIVLIQMNFYTFDNRYLLDSIARYPGAFRGVAIVDETQPDVATTMKRLARQGVRGFRLYADAEKVEAWSRSPGMKAMWTCAADTGLSLCLLANPEALPAIRRMCRNYPRTRVVIDHFGRLGMKHPARPAELENLLRLSEHRHAYVKTSAFYALGAKRPPYTDLGPLIRQLRDNYGAKRLIWGSDSPFQVQPPHTYAASIALIRDRLDFLTPEDKAWMLRKTAEKVFFA